MTFWQKEIFTFNHFTLTVGKVILILLTIIGFKILLLSLNRLLFLRKDHLSQNEKGRRLSLFQLITYFVWVSALALIIAQLGFDVTFLVAGSAALMVGLGFGLQNIFGDLVSGLFMLFEQKVKVGDVMEVDKIVGSVQDINLRSSVLLTRDGYNIIVPNHKFITENVVNWTHQVYTRRFQVEVGVSYNCDPDLVSKVLLDCASCQPEIIQENKFKPLVRLYAFNESSLLFQLLFWTTDIFGVEQVKSNLRFKILKEFTNARIEIPFPQRDIHIKTDY